VNGFPVEWLHLREPFDHQARSRALVETLVAALPSRRPLRILELGAGLGSGMRYLAPQLPEAQQWTLVDHDPALLAAVGEPPGPEVRVETLELDLADPAALTQEADLVSTQALLDLVSEAWLGALTEWLVDRRLPLLAALTVDGRVHWTPEDPRDTEVQAAFRAHQRTDRGFGPSPGSRAAPVLSGMLARAGHRVSLARADWDVGPGFTQMLSEMVEGTARAAAEAAAGITQPETVRNWRANRLAAIEAGSLSLRVGHLDLLALP